MTDCEFIKLCEEAFGATVPGCRNDYWRGCPNYDLCVLVHNQAIEESKKIVKWLGEVVRPLDAVMQALQKLEALKKPASQEGV